MNNEKFQEFMTDQFAKMFNVVQDVKDSQIRMESRLNNVKSELGEVKHSQIRMENDFGKKQDVLYYDWRETQKQFNEEVKTELKILGTKVEALQMESTKHDQEIKDLYLVKASKD